MEDKTPEQLKVDGLKEILEKYKSSNAVIKINPNAEETEVILNMDYSELKRQDAETLGEYALIVSKYNYHLQMLINTEITIASWAEANVNHIIYKDFENYKKPYATAEENKYRAILGNEVATLYDRIRVNSSLRVTTLQQLTMRLDDVVRTLSDLSKTKRRTWNQTQTY